MTRSLRVPAIALAALTAAAALTLTACTGQAVKPTSSIGPEPTTATLDWKPCGDGFDCATMRVPLSYDNAAGATIGLGLVRHNATGTRTGTLVVNPGGPGGSGIDYARAASYIVTPAVLEHFDIVGFDPRGVGMSTPLHCLTGQQLDALMATDGTPDTPAEIQALADTAQVVRDGCTADNQQLITHMTTQDVARDLDRLRLALGEETLNYLGKSYGTFLGLTYAEMFPNHVGRFVLDGVLPADLDGDALALGQAQGFETAIRSFAADCARRSSCVLGKDAGAAFEKIVDFLAGLEVTPLQTNDSARPLTEPLATYSIFMQMYSPTQWPKLRDALTAAFAGNGTPLLDLLDAATRRGADGTYADNSMDVFYAVSCSDRPTRHSVSELESIADSWQGDNTFGAYFAWANATCMDWPYPSGVSPHAITAKGAAPILVVSTTRDPATPYDWGVQVANELADARLVSYDGDGHTAYFNGSTCVDSVVDAYLLDGTVPANDVTC